MQNLAQEMYDFFVSAFGLTPEEVDQLEKKNAEQAEEILNKDKEIEKLKVLLAQKE